MEERLFDLFETAEFGNEPQKIKVYETEKTSAAMWCLEPGQEVFLHQHPNADDVWICIEGESGTYFAGDGVHYTIKKGMAVLAGAGQVHGMRNIGNDRFVFIGVSAPVPVETERL